MTSRQSDKQSEGKQIDKLTLSFGTWITLMATVCAGIAANLGLIYTMAGNLQNRMDKLDQRWQDRITHMKESLGADIRAVEAKIPTDWFSKMVERNTSQIEKIWEETNKLENEILTLKNQK